MKLEPGERSLLAYFPSSESARKAAEELKSMGYDTVQVDRISRYGAEADDEVNYPPAGRAESGSGLTLFSAGAGDPGAGERMLHAADPSVGGYGDTDYGLAGGRAFLVTVVTDGGNYGQVAGILEKHGGKI